MPSRPRLRSLHIMENARLYETTGNPLPGTGDCGYFDGARGKKLRYAIFRADPEAKRGTILLLQGRNECIEKYFETIGNLMAAGFNVATFDLRGQGGSERLTRNPMAGHVRRFRDYEQDTLLFLEQLEGIHRLPQPVFLLAHSTGALAAIALALRLKGRIARMALCAPFIGLSGQGVPQPLARFLVEFYCLAGLGKMQVGKSQRERHFEDNPLTADPVRFARNQRLSAERPELSVGRPTALWLRESLRTAARVTRQDYLTKVTIPTLVLAPVRDPITPYPVVEAMSRRFRACQLIPVTGARHELLQERDIFRAQALAAIDAFFVPEER